MGSGKVDVYVGVHKGLRNLISRFLVQAGAANWGDEASVAGLQAQWENVTRVLHSHHEHEDHFVHPVLERVVPGGHRSYETEHKAQCVVLGDLESHFRRLAQGDRSAHCRAEIGLEFYRALNLFYADYLRHLYREEVEADRALSELCSQEELKAAVGEIIASIPPDEMMIYIDCMFPAMNPAERAGLLGDMRAGAPPEVFAALAGRVRQALGEAGWKPLQAALGL